MHAGTPKTSHVVDIFYFFRIFLVFSGKNIIINNVDIFVSYNFIKFLNLSFENWEYMITGIFMFKMMILENRENENE